MIGRRRKTGLTIIELLIVVAIILVLAGIGMENYVAASIRARVARVRTEFRSIATGIEAYRVDHNELPRMASWGFYRDPAFDRIKGIPVSGVMSKVLSTPISYISDSYIIDPFMTTQTSLPLDEQLYTYQVIPVYVSKNPQSTFWPKARDYYGDWRLGSVGPDQIFDHGFLNSSQLVYDPTNGLITLGNIWYSQRNPSEPPSVPGLVGVH